MELWGIKYLSIHEYKPVNYVKAIGTLRLTQWRQQTKKNTKEFTLNKEHTLIYLCSEVILKADVIFPPSRFSIFSSECRRDKRCAACYKWNPTRHLLGSLCVLAECEVALDDFCVSFGFYCFIYSFHLTFFSSEVFRYMFWNAVPVCFFHLAFLYMQGIFLYTLKCCILVLMIYSCCNE